MYSFYGTTIQIKSLHILSNLETGYSLVERHSDMIGLNNNR